jgi:hypothetical protein
MLKKRTPNYTYQWGWNMTYHSLVLQAVRLHPREPVQLHHHFFAVFADLCMFHSSLNTTHVQPTMLCKRKFTVPWKFSTSISSCPKHSSCNLTSDAYPYEPKAQLNLMIAMKAMVYMWIIPEIFNASHQTITWTLNVVGGYILPIRTQQFSVYCTMPCTNIWGLKLAASLLDNATKKMLRAMQHNVETLPWSTATVLKFAYSWVPLTNGEKLDTWGSVTFIILVC